MEHPRSIRNVNLLYLVAFVGLLVGSVLLPAVSLGWRVVINEMLLVGLPLALYLLLAREDARRLVRLRGVSWPVAALSLVVGLGMWRFDWLLATAVNQLLDYTIPLPPEALNVTLLDQILMAVGTVVLAPIIEELLFRGLLQSAYERRGAVRAVVASTLLFIAIHQELAQSVALLPVALALGYVAWRTQSVIPAMLIHLGNNAQAMAVSFLEGRVPRQMAFTPSTVGGLVGGAVAVAALLLLTRLTKRPDTQREPPRRGWLARTWPLFPVVPIYAAVIGLGVLVGLRPEALAVGQRVELGSAPWEEETRWRYEISNALEESVGEAECLLTLESGSYVLDCSMEQSAYEADAPTGFFQEGGATQRQTARWDRGTLALEELLVEATVPGVGEEVTVTARLEDDGLAVRAAGEDGMEETFDLCYRLGQTADGGEPPPVQEPCRVEDGLVAGGGYFSPLMVGEWPWRFSALPFQLAYSREATVVWPYRSVEALDSRAPAKQDVFVVVRTADQVSTPAGEFVTWQVTVGERYTAWYTVEPPHHLVAYSDEMVTWRLVEVE